MNNEIVSLLLIGITAWVSYTGFQNPVFFSRHTFQVGSILGQQQYGRMISSGFLHADWIHLIFNMLSLYIFAGSLAISTGSFILIYFTSLIGGNIFALWVYRHLPSYTAVGASGAVCGLMFASVAYNPGMSLSLLFLPIYIPGWLYALLFVFASIYGIRSRYDNIGHEAHLAGAVSGMLLALALDPGLFMYNPITIVVVLTPALIFLFMVIRKPHALTLGTFRERGYLTKDDAYNARKKIRQKELDILLDKIHQHGFDSLTPEEKNRLDKLSQ